MVGFLSNPGKQTKAIQYLQRPCMKTVGTASLHAICLVIEHTCVQAKTACPGRSHQPRRTSAHDDQVMIGCFVSCWGWSSEDLGLNHCMIFNTDAELEIDQKTVLSLGRSRSGCGI
jgi:hypothetical protein